MFLQLDESQTSTRQIKKVCQDNDLHYGVVYMVQTKARQALGKPRKFVNTTIYIHRVVYTTQMKVRMINYSEKILITWTTHLKNKQGLDIQTKKTSTKIKDLHSKGSIVSCYKSWSTKVDYIKHYHQEKELQY